MTRLAAGLAAFTAAGASPVAAQPATGGPWTPTRHPQDEWFEQLPGQHRVFFDATTAQGAGEALQFANNFLVASRSGYELGDSDNAIVIGLRHWATPFAFSDAIWQRYGAIFGERIHFQDPKTSAAPVLNVYLSKGYGLSLPNRENTFTEAVQHRVHFAVCDMATRALAGLIASRLSLQVTDVVAELHGAAHAQSHFVPAGIVAATRAQERGYAIQHLG